MQLFYDVDNIPVHSTLQMATPEAAVNYPRGQLKLGFCPSCGFVHNSVFDSSVHEYSSNCEESQGFSPTFNSFAKKLAQRWIDRYDLRNKEILEIGCGKGEFLVLMCELGNNRGIGIDPSYQPDRNPSKPLPPGLRFIQDHYSRKVFAPDGRLRDVPPYARAHRPDRPVSALDPQHDRRPPRHPGALRAPRRLPRYEGRRLLGHLLRALLLFQPRLAGPAIPPVWLRADRARSRLQRSVPPDRRPPHQGHFHPGPSSARG